GSGEDRVQLVEELAVGRAGEVIVECALDAGVALVEGEVAGRGSVELWVRVGAQELEVAVDRNRLGDRRARDQDGPALGREAVIERAGIVAIGAQAVRLEGGDDAARDQQRDEHQQHGNADPLQLLVHASLQLAHASTTNRGWLRMLSESLSSSATMIQLAT